MRLSQIVMLAALSLVIGCAGKEQLIAKSADVPTGVDLSGQWQLRAASRDTVRRITEAEIEAAGGKDKLVLAPERQARRSRQRSTVGTIVHVFLETGTSLKVTQTTYGLFISFDRAVVEEYRFGEQREISVGPVVASRVSGWEGRAYVIETLDKNGAKLIETYRLQHNDDSLIRTISIVRDGASELDIEQVFDRV